MRNELVPILEAVEAIQKRLPRDLKTRSAFMMATGLSRSSVARKIKSGDLPTVNIGGITLIDVSAIPQPITEDDIARAAREARGP